MILDLRSLYRRTCKLQALPLSSKGLSSQHSILYPMHYALRFAFLKLAEVHGNRTHRGHLLPATGFEVQEAHQNLTTSLF